MTKDVAKCINIFVIVKRERNIADSVDFLFNILCCVRNIRILDSSDTVLC